MKKSFTRHVLWFFPLLLLSGCGRIVDWAKPQIDQGKDLKDYTKTPASYIRSKKIYNEFSTAASFDVMWLSNPVRQAYANLYNLKHGKTEALRKAFLRRQFEENRHYISFYVLTNFELSFGEPMSEWSPFLDVGDAHLQPAEIKIVDLSPEYKAFFGNKFTIFKTAYLVKFNAKNNEDAPLISPDIKEISLYFRSVEKEVVLTWPVIHVENDKKEEVAQ